jgi:hypothetical protein
MKHFILILMMTIGINVANANSSYQTSHVIEYGYVHTINPVECDFDVPKIDYCSSYIESNVNSIVSIEQPVFNVMIFAPDFTDMLPLHSRQYKIRFNYNARINHYSSYLSNCTNTKLRCWTVAKRYNNKNHYSG